MDVYSQFCELVKILTTNASLMASILTIVACCKEIPRSNFFFNAAVIIVSNYCGDCLLTPIYEKFFYKFALLFEFVRI